MLAYWFIMLLWPSATLANVIYKESGENVTLNCSSEGCSQSSTEYDGMYLYHDFIIKDEVLFWYGSSNKISPRKKYSGRVQSNGPFRNNSMTISGLTVNDTGIYTCAYVKRSKTNKCNEYTLVVRGYLPCVETPAEEKCPQPVVFIIAAVSCVVAMLLFIIFFILIILKVKKTCIHKRPAPSEFTVYEDMTRKCFQPVVVAE